MDTIVALLDAALASGLGSAAAVSVGDAGREVFVATRGHTRRIPDRGAAIDATTPFDVASVTKPMVTIACAMRMVADGRLDLDAPVRRYLPEASTTGTLAQLLGHAAGCLPHVEFFRALQTPQADPHAALVARAAAEPANPPGIAAVYSDLGYILAGEIIARVTGAPLEDAFVTLVGAPLALAARFVRGRDPALATAVSTELDEPGAATTETVLPHELRTLSIVDARAGTTRRGLLTGRVHDENAYFGGGVCGHAGLFASITDVGRFATALVDPHGPFAAALPRFATTAAAPDTSWRLGWDTPSPIPGVSQAGDRWPRTGAIGHTGFTGTSLWLDLPRRRWVALLTNRVHPTRLHTAEPIKALRRAVNDAALAALDG